MGNCLRREPSNMVWAGEDWGSVGSKRRRGSTRRVMDDGEDDDDHRHGQNAGDVEMEKQRLLTSSPSTREVKIKITKKELEELLQRVDVQGLSLEQVLAKLIDGNDHHVIQHGQLEHQRSWRPVLQSIPEVN